MNKHMKKIIFLALFYSLSTNIFAANTWKNATYIEGVQALNDNRFILYLPAGSDPICKEAGKLFYVAPTQNGVTVDGAKNILSLALVAFTTGKKVSIRYNNGTSSCYVQQIHLRNDN
jgi:hypothetical protein